MRRHWLILILLSLTLSLSVPLLYGGLQSVYRLGRLSPWVMLLLLGMVLVGWLFNAARLMVLGRALEIPFAGRGAMTTVVSTEFAGLATPAASGAAPTFLFLLSRHGFPLGPAAGVLAVDFVMDVVFFLTALPGALALYAFGENGADAGRLVILVAVALGGGVVALVALTRYYRPLAIRAGRLLGHHHRLRRFRFRLARSLVNFRASVRLLFRMGRGRLLLLYALCFCHWTVRYSILPVLLYFMGHPVPWAYLFVGQGLVLFGGLMTFIPGGGGGVEAGLSALLHPYLDPRTTATAMLAWRFVTFYWYLIVGAPVFATATGAHARRLMSRSGTEPGEDGPDR
ncbi:MAG TPA: lysylphosphatidylglycerol synthase transmembrane domain-containing protein [Gammaproteobacteria bacterium]|nr:lysylphosphatidylglycerol synthase transmembrane domain-containing protein [Gammaproteobacteria bacterium]